MSVRETLDRIHIRNLSARCIVGIRDWERKKRQDISIDITLYADLSRACLSDNIEDTVDYHLLKNSIIEMVEGSRFHLIERLAESIAELCLAQPQVVRVDVTVDKPGALRFARSVAVAFTRYKETR